MLYEPHRDTFLFSPFRSLSTDAGWNRVATNFTVSNCFVPRYLYIYIYVYGWKKRKDPTMEFFFFFYSSLLPISRDFRDFSPQIGSSNRLLFPFTLREGIRSIIGLC